MTSDKLDATAPAEQPPADSPTRRVRMLLWILGLCLWVLAALGTYTVWRARQAAAEQNTTPKSGEPAATANAAGASAPAGASEPIVLTPADNAEPPTRIWDPAGVQDFQLTERSGRPVTKQDLLGKPWAVAFIFTRCAGTCFQIAGSMRELQQATAGTDIRLVCISVDPDYDTPAELKKYADAFGADPDRWLFLTGDKEQIYQLITRSFLLPVYETTGAERKPGYEVIHSNFILHVNAAGVVSDKYVGTDDADVVKLRRALLKEAESLASGDVRAGNGAGAAEFVTP